MSVTTVISDSTAHIIAGSQGHIFSRISGPYQCSKIAFGEAIRGLVPVIKFQMYPIWLVEWPGLWLGGECLAASRVNNDEPACQTRVKPVRVKVNAPSCRGDEHPQRIKNCRSGLFAAASLDLRPRSQFLPALGHSEWGLGNCVFHKVWLTSRYTRAVKHFPGVFATTGFMPVGR